MRKHIILTIILLIGLSPIAQGQYYAPGDTSYEYHMKGTVYANKFEGRKTASGEVFRQNLYTAAHWKIKMGTLVMVSCPETGLQVIVKINDRCPKRGLIDLTRRAATDIGIKGLKNVVVKQLPDSYRQQWEEQNGGVTYAEPKPVVRPKSGATASTSKTAPKRPAVEDDEDEPQF